MFLRQQHRYKSSRRELGLSHETKPYLKPCYVFNNYVDASSAKKKKNPRPHARCTRFMSSRDVIRIDVTHISRKPNCWDPCHPWSQHTEFYFLGGLGRDQGTFSRMWVAGGVYTCVRPLSCTWDYFRRYGILVQGCECLRAWVYAFCYIDVCRRMCPCKSDLSRHSNTSSHTPLI